MAKKDLKAGVSNIRKVGGFNSLLTDTTAAPVQKEQEQTKSSTPSVYGRMCAVVNTTLQAKLQEIARSNNLTFKEVLEQAMEKAVQAYEEKHGEVVVPSATKKNNKPLF